MSTKLTTAQEDLLFWMRRHGVVVSRWGGDDVPGLPELEGSGLVERTGPHGWTYRITPAGRAALQDGKPSS